MTVHGGERFGEWQAVLNGEELANWQSPDLEIVQGLQEREPAHLDHLGEEAGVLQGLDLEDIAAQANEEFRGGLERVVVALIYKKQIYSRVFKKDKDLKHT